jgi:hypothetical protein
VISAMTAVVRASVRSLAMLNPGGHTAGVLPCPAGHPAANVIVVEPVMGSKSGDRAAVRADVLHHIDPTHLLGLVLVIALGASAWNFGRYYAQVDYYQFWAVGRLAGTGVTDIYSDQARHFLAGRFKAEAQASGSQRAVNADSHWPVLETYATPFLYAVIGAISTGDYEFDTVLWQLLRFGAFLAAALALCRLFRYSWAGGLVAVSVILGTSVPLRNDLASGNVNEVQVGVLAALLVLRARWPTPSGDLAAGVLLGLLVGFKPDTAPIALLLVVLWVVDRRFGTLVKQLVGMCIGALVTVAVGTVAWASFQPWLDWVGALGDLATRAQYSLDQQNYSLARFLVETTGANLTPVLVLGLAAAVIAGMLRGRLSNKAPEPGFTDRGRAEAHRPPNRRFERECLVVGAGIAVVLLGSPIAWLHYFLLLVPLQLFLMRPTEDDEAPITGLVRQLLAASSALLLAFVTIDTVFGPGASVDAAQAIVATVILLVLSISGLARRESTLAALVQLPDM